MRTLQGLTLGVIALALVLAASAMAVQPVTITTTTYAVRSSAVPGASTGLVLAGNSVISRRQEPCARTTAPCAPGPTGTPGTTRTRAPTADSRSGRSAWGLVARVGSGAWKHVGAARPPHRDRRAPVRRERRLPRGQLGQLLGHRDLERGLAHRLGLHAGTGERGQEPRPRRSSGPDRRCVPAGLGNGDANHDHGGPPGQANAGTTASTGAGPGNGNGNGNGKAKGQAKH